MPATEKKIVTKMPSTGSMDETESAKTEGKGKRRRDGSEIDSSRGGRDVRDGHARVEPKRALHRTALLSNRG